MSLGRAVVDSQVVLDRPREGCAGVGLEVDHRLNLSGGLSVEVFLYRVKRRTNLFSRGQERQASEKREVRNDCLAVNTGNLWFERYRDVVGGSTANVLDGNKKSPVVTEEVYDHVRYTEMTSDGICKLRDTHDPRLSN